MDKNYNAILSGLFASSASFFGKLIGSVTESGDSIFQNIWIMRLVCIVLMVLSNALVWTFFVKALHNSGGTLVATVMSAASNYIISFILGAVVFREEITLNTLIGLLLILIGLIFINKNSMENDKDKIK